jgi:hypothetical protein
MAKDGAVSPKPQAELLPPVVAPDPFPAGEAPANSLIKDRAVETGLFSESCV